MDYAYHNGPWHAVQRDIVYDQRTKGEDRVRANLPFSHYHIARSYYDAGGVKYFIQLDLYVRSPAVEHVAPIFTWSEPADEFPSDLLLTKLILITGGMVNA